MEYILKTAFIQFSIKGYKAVTLSELEQATKLTRGAFYHHFRSKEELFLGVIEKYLLTSYNSFPHKRTTTLREQINSNIIFLHDKMLELISIIGTKVPDPYFLSLILEAKKHFPFLENKIRSTFRDQINLWERTIVNAKDSGEIRNDIDSFALAETFTSIGLGIIKNLVLDENIDYALTKIQNQYNQLYRLIKV